MRITNKMMTNNMLYNINNNKNRLNKLDEQYSTGLKIQRPSDDPIVAVRALKLRTNLSELNQYYEKNIPDAMSWMETTESALQTTNEILTKMHTYSVQGANDTLTAADRESIITNLTELKKQIHQEGDTNYAGRYVFSGYKTDTSLIFTEDVENLNYTISEKLSGENIEVCTRVTNFGIFKDYDPDNPEDYDTEVKPEESTVYRIQLAYKDLKMIDEDGSLDIGFPETDENGNWVYDEDGEIVYGEMLDDSSVNVMTSDNPLAYLSEMGEINYLEDTGELILSEDIYNAWRNRDFHITYQKDKFKENDLRPEHYFDCIVYDNTIEDEDLRDEKTIYYTKENQEISFEVNFNQKMCINTQGSDAITHKISRTADDMIKAISDVTLIENDINRVKEMLSDRTLSEEQRSKLNDILENMETELTLKSNVLQKVFSNSIYEFEKQQDIVNVALADLGTRYNRLELTESRLSDQQIDFTDLLSANEDADMVDTIVKFNSQQVIYNASLSAASKVVQNTLLDFL